MKLLILFTGIFFSYQSLAGEKHTPEGYCERFQKKISALETLDAMLVSVPEDVRLRHLDVILNELDESSALRQTIEQKYAEFHNTLTDQVWTTEGVTPARKSVLSDNEIVLLRDETDKILAREKNMYVSCVKAWEKALDSPDYQ